MEDSPPLVLEALYQDCLNIRMNICIVFQKKKKKKKVKHNYSNIIINLCNKDTIK